MEVGFWQLDEDSDGEGMGDPKAAVVTVREERYCALFANLAAQVSHADAASPVHGGVQAALHAYPHGWERYNALKTAHMDLMLQLHPRLLVHPAASDYLQYGPQAGGQEAAELQYIRGKFGESDAQRKLHQSVRKAFGRLAKQHRANPAHEAREASRAAAAAEAKAARRAARLAAPRDPNVMRARYERFQLCELLEERGDIVSMKSHFGVGGGQDLDTPDGMCRFLAAHQTLSPTLTDEICHDRHSSWLEGLGAAEGLEGFPAHAADMGLYCPDLFQQYAKPSAMLEHWRPREVAQFANWVIAAVCSGRIFTEAGKGEFITCCIAALFGCGAYSAPHCYRTLMEVLGRGVPGDSMFLMGAGADEETFEALEPWGITGLASFNEVMRQIIGEKYVPVADVGRLSYYECMITDEEYIAQRRQLSAGAVEAAGLDHGGMAVAAEGVVEGVAEGAAGGGNAAQGGGLLSAGDEDDASSNSKNCDHHGPPAKRPRAGEADGAEPQTGAPTTYELEDIELEALAAQLKALDLTRDRLAARVPSLE